MPTVERGVKKFILRRARKRTATLSEGCRHVRRVSARNPGHPTKPSPQKLNFAETWKERGLPFWAVMVPKAVLVTVVLGSVRLGWLSEL
jgi:hypothetical protein